MIKKNFKLFFIAFLIFICTNVQAQDEIILEKQENTVAELDFENKINK